MGRGRSLWLLAVLALVGLVGMACGSNDDGDEAGGSTTTVRSRLVEPEGDPVSGGSLVFGVEAETTGWDPRIDRWAISGHQVAQAVYETLAAYDEDGEVRPNLAESFTPSEEFTQWDIGLREGITFHDGSPLDADAVKGMLDGHLASPLTGSIFRTVESVEVVDELTVRVTTSEPWASFPVVLTMQVGYVPAPAQLEGDEASQVPIGTGPFQFVEWEPDSKLVVERNPDYWRTDENGVQLPYLDEIEFRPIHESAQRVNALLSGELDALHTSDPRSVENLRAEADAENIQEIEDGGLGEESFVMLNTMAPPLDNPDVRRALALATNAPAYAETIDKGIREVARTPFAQGLPWYSQEAADAYPAYDPEAARDLVAEIEAEQGPLEVTLGTTPTPENREAIQFLGAQWEEVGIDVEYKETEQGVFITDAISGSFEANLWRQFGAADPDGDYVWWDINNANDIGTFSLNFARNRDEELQAALDRGRASDDPDTREAAYDEAQLLMNQDIPYLWLTHTVWAIGADNSVRNLGTGSLPDGEPMLGLGAGFYGSMSLTEVWLDQ